MIVINSNFSFSHTCIIAWSRPVVKIMCSGGARFKPFSPRITGSLFAVECLLPRDFAITVGVHASPNSTNLNSHSCRFIVPAVERLVFAFAYCASPAWVGLIFGQA